jgi:tRNA dimethylallyltransferase
MTSEEKNPRRAVLCIVGPTASGKTKLSLLLAPLLNGEIISADSRQVYKHLDIGTAKPTREERREIIHHFVDELDPKETFNAGEFGKRGRRLIESLFRRGKTPIVVGGSGLYLKSLIDGLFEGPSADQSIRRRLYDRLHKEGPEALLKELHRVDADSAERMLPTNTRRIVRALEVYEITGTPISKLHSEKVGVNFSPLLIGLEWDRRRLYERINQRVEMMLNRGLIDEVRALMEKGYPPETNSLQTVGYQEVIIYLQGKTDYPEMVELIKRNTRRFAKRQLTWFRRDKRIHWFKVEDEKEFPSIARKTLELFKRSIT